MLNPADNIVPILGQHANGRHTFLGTGSFIAPSGLVLTADHVVRDWNRGPLAVTTMDRLEEQFIAVVVHRDKVLDLALLRVNGYAAPSPLQLDAPGNIRPNVAVLCFEYGTTISAGGVTRLSPATRMGNVTRLIGLTDQYDRAGEDMLELSFPALRGASGAPVLTNVGFRLWGVVVANVAYHLLPAQIEQVTDGDQVTEQTKFMLPQALAVNVRLVHEFLKSLGHAA